MVIFFVSVGSSLAFQNGLLTERVHQTFISEIGVKEQGGDNQGDRIAQYLATTGLDAGYPWCAAFLSWGFTTNHIDNPQSAWSPDWFPEQHTIYVRPDGTSTKVWRPVDVIGLWFSNKGRVAHVGVIDRVTEDMVITIEGNTNDYGSREGDRVMRKRRYKRQIYSVSRYVTENNNRNERTYYYNPCAFP